jgi:uncharacterized protein (DUF488 family)
MKRTIATIGYEGASMDAFLRALRRAKVDLLVDVRAVVSSRRPGFSKTALAANLETIGVEYVHLRGLGTPAEGRAAARAGQHEKMRAIFREQLATRAAEADLERLAEFVRGGRRACLMCFEADPTHCHRTLVADALQALAPARVEHLAPVDD